MSVKVAINGFGRIGRLAFRQMFGAEGYEVVAINDLTSPKMLAHLLKYDSTQGTYALADTVEAGEDSITVDGKEIKIYAKANAAELPWGEIGVDVVLECTGFYTSKAKAQAHIDAGAKKVVIVSQKYHLYRSLYIAKKMGLDAYGVSSDLRYYSKKQYYREAREWLARVKSFIKCIAKPEPKYLGDSIDLKASGDVTND